MIVRRHVIRLLLVAFAVAAAAAPVKAAAPAAPPAPAPGSTVEVTGLVDHPGRFTTDDLRRLPASTETVFYSTGHGPVRASFTGVPLWSLFGTVGLKADAARNANLRRYVVARGGDGYYVVIALAELDPEFGAHLAILAYEQDGKPVAPRLIVPGDKGGGRNVANVVALEVRSAEK